MNKPIIDIKGVGKKYNITHQRGGYIALRDILAGIIKNPFRFAKRKAKQIIGLETKEEFWALKEIDLEINKGDVVGIIGHNGAGKSTLLKILTGITPPTEGEIHMRGRVASLLEVGTGFHPELTGRENIFLNGAILGMTKKEIAHKFDEIVAFAGIERFLDTPVKHYSSGMYVRLAFSVAAHMEPDILLVDEVLAVGDAEFQKKCLGKMSDVVKGANRTIFFVSHNMAAIEQLCTRCVLLEKGKLQYASENVRAVIDHYLKNQSKASGVSEWKNTGNDYDNQYFTPLRFAFTEKNGELQIMPTKNNSDIHLQITLLLKQVEPKLNIAYAVYKEDGELIYWSTYSDTRDNNWQNIKSGEITLLTEIPKHILNEGTYRVELLSWIHNTEWIIKEREAPVITLTIEGGLSDSPHWTTKRPGLLAPLIEWKIK